MTPRAFDFPAFADGDVWIEPEEDPRAERMAARAWRILRPVLENRGAVILRAQILGFRYDRGRDAGESDGFVVDGGGLNIGEMCRNIGADPEWVFVTSLVEMSGFDFRTARRLVPIVDNPHHWAIHRIIRERRRALWASLDREQEQAER